MEQLTSTDKKPFDDYHAKVWCAITTMILFTILSKTDTLPPPDKNCLDVMFEKLYLPNLYHEGIVSLLTQNLRLGILREFCN